MGKLICECYNITIEDMIKHIEEGVSTYQELQEKTKIGTDCPSCKITSSKLFYELLKESSETKEF